MKQARQRPPFPEDLPDTEFKKIRRLSPDFKIILFVPKIVKNTPTPFPQSVLLTATKISGFKWELPTRKISRNDKSFREAVTRVGKETIGNVVRLHSIIGVGTQVNSFGFICLTISRKAIRESEKLRYFKLAKFPWGEIVPDHKVFINSYVCDQIHKIAKQGMNRKSIQ